MRTDVRVIVLLPELLDAAPDLLPREERLPAQAHVEREAPADVVVVLKVQAEILITIVFKPILPRGSPVVYSLKSFRLAWGAT